MFAGTDTPWEEGFLGLICTDLLGSCGLSEHGTLEATGMALLIRGVSRMHKWKEIFNKTMLRIIYFGHTE